jgi:DNA helicase HerA-like ATPase
MSDITFIMDEKSIVDIAREGRKYDVGVCVLCRKPSEFDRKLLSQCCQIIPISSEKYLATTYPIFTRK